MQVRNGERIADVEPRAVTLDRMTVLELQASRAAISRENAGLHSDQERSEMLLAIAQSLSHTGCFVWSASGEEIYWSAEMFVIFEHNRTVKPTLESVLRRIHPDARHESRKAICPGRGSCCRRARPRAYGQVQAGVGRQAIPRG